MPADASAKRRRMAARPAMPTAAALLFGPVLFVLTACQSTAPQTDRPAAESEPIQAVSPMLEEEDSQAAALVEAENLTKAGQWRSAITALAEAWPSAADRQALNDQLWRLTAAAPPSRAAALAQMEAAELRAVWSLRSAMNAAFSATEKADRLAAWLRQQPRHPLAAPLPRALAQLRQRPPPPARVGLFVPLSGPLTAAGEAVRDGFFSAYLQDSASAKPEVRLYDTATQDIAALYQRSRDDGVAFIVGPLQRAAVESLHELAPETPVLGLNYLSDRAQDVTDADPIEPAQGNAEDEPSEALAAEVPMANEIAELEGRITESAALAAEAPTAEVQGDEAAGTAWVGAVKPLVAPTPNAQGGEAAAANSAETPQTNFRTLGLAIEDEAASIGRRLLADGLERILVVRNSEDWAWRGAEALAAAWPHRLEQQRFANIRNITDALGEALQVAASKARHERLQELLGDELQFLPRARGDIDGLVAFVDHLQALALAPAVRFHLSDGPPIYASSQSVRGAAKFAELEGFKVAEMPFRLSSGPLEDALAQGFRHSANLSSLFALGIDAYRLFDHWPLLPAAESLRGATGILTPGEDGRIGRRLAWATVANGRLRALPETATPH